MKLYGDRPPREAAEALVRRRINGTFAKVRKGEDWREQFTLTPGIVPCWFEGRSGYGRRVWVIRVPVFTPGPIASVEYNFTGARFVVTRRWFWQLRDDVTGSEPQESEA